MATMGWAAAVILAAAVLTVRPSTAGAMGNAGLVGPLGDPARLNFAGPLPASAERLRFLLGGDVEVALAAAPERPLADYLSALDRRLREALWSAGYRHPDVAVDATTTPGRVVVRIDAGPRRHQGDVRITGDTDGLDVPALRRRLVAVTAPGLFGWEQDGDTWAVGVTRKAEDPYAVWGDAGEWAWFDDFHAGRLTASVTTALAEMGYLHARVAVAVTDDGSAGVLGVRVRSLGPAATIARVDVTGAHTNAPAAVADVAGLHAGQRLNLTQLEAAQQRLWDCGRFDRHTIAARPATDDDPARVVITIDVRESDGPPLGQPFSPVEQALLHTRDWVTTLATADRDVRLNGRIGSPTGTHADFVVALGGGRTGVAGLTRFVAGGDRPLDVEGGVALTPTLAGFYLPAEHRQCVARGAAFQLQPSARVDPADDAPSGHRQRWNIILRCAVAGIGGGERPAGPPVKLDLSIAPAAMVDAAHAMGYDFALRDGVLTATQKTSTSQPATQAASGPAGAPFRVRIAADTGAILGLEGGGTDGPMARRIGPGLVAAQAADLGRAVGPTAVDGYDPDHFFCSWLVFLDVEFARFWMLSQGVPAPRVDRAGAVLGKAFAAATFAPLAMPAGAMGDDTDLSMPPPTALPNGNPTWLAMAAVALPINDHLFGRETWPWRVGRAGAFLIAGQTDAAGQQLRPVAADGGPLACLVTAEALTLRSPAASRPFARLGLGRLTDDAFDRDVRGLLADGSATAETARRVVDAIRKLTPGEVDDLVGGLPPAAGPRVRAAIGAARMLAGQSGDRAAELLLSQAWEHGLKECVAAELRRLAGPR